MTTNRNFFTVFEHEKLVTDPGEQSLSNDQLKALQVFSGENGVPYYTLINNGVKFTSFVGVLQIGHTIIEVLPKADRHSGDANSWRNTLISMLRVVGAFDIRSPSSSDLRLKANTILPLYFELFVREVEKLLHRGLVRKYRVTEGNKYALKGSLQFSKQIQHNLVHQERFFVRHSSYDKSHTLNAILYKTIRLLKQLNTNIQLKSRIGSLLFNFPEQRDLWVGDTTFKRIKLDRSTEPYRRAIEIARLLLLNYHPDVQKGKNHVLALMFNMDALWERFVFASLSKHSSDILVTKPKSKNFWKPSSGHDSTMLPDIVINEGTKNCIVLDTKWKNLDSGRPSPGDLRQLFVYMKYYKAKKAALVYPGATDNTFSGWFYKHDLEGSEELSQEECSIITLGHNEDTGLWQESIRSVIRTWMGSSTPSS